MKRTDNTLSDVVDREEWRREGDLNSRGKVPTSFPGSRLTGLGHLGFTTGRDGFCINNFSFLPIPPDVGSEILQMSADHTFLCQVLCVHSECHDALFRMAVNQGPSERIQSTGTAVHPQTVHDAYVVHISHVADVLEGPGWEDRVQEGFGLFGGRCQAYIQGCTVHGCGVEGFWEEYVVAYAEANADAVVMGDTWSIPCFEHMLRVDPETCQMDLVIVCISIR